ncbi:hypothetical protein ID858_13670 [Xenorhabdus sp. DI]|uniref:hypothetical protein n=1 Tax=Xenorhabdus doucetiae TaxID=351671 RepID=UPI0019956ADB|nr:MULTISPECIES: hypothetical protein [unclassified Xenorhabdus]MBD2785901.1 hypothetical protein [Xenorhabdus sp. 3]MBD2789558.1 hypothetical protein [Xenorhabdus sp. DI]
MSGTIKFSLPNNGDLIIGQSFLFTVTLLSDNDIDNNSTITFYNSENITVPSDAIRLTLDQDKKKAMATVTLTVLNSISENEKIYFSVKTSLSGIQSQTLQSTAKTINSNSLELISDNIFLPMPISFNNSQIGSVSTKIHTIIRDKDGVVLSGVPVFIKANVIEDLDDLIIYADNKETVIDVQKFGDYYGFFVSSDEKGKIEFYIAPKKSLSLIIQLSSVIPNSTDFVFAQNPIFIFSDNIKDYQQPLEVITAIDGNLTSEGESKFWVDISPCKDYEIGDFLLFLVNEEYKYYTRILNKDKNSPCLMELPYFIFQKDELSRLSYLAIKSGGGVLAKSSPVDVTYRGRPNKPWQDVNRVYEPCQVYTSFDVLLEQDEHINNQKISNHSHNPDDAGLFVRITGINDNSDAAKAKLGSEIILNLYINSKNRTITQAFKQRMPYQPDEPGGKTATLTFNIPYNLLDNNWAFPYHGGEIFFDYQIGNDYDRDVTYGGIWSGFIVTP